MNDTGGGSSASTGTAAAGRPARSGRLRLPIVFGMLLATTALSAQAMPCLAYRHNDQVRIRCGAQDKLLITKKGLYDFAISGEHLALLIGTGSGPEISVGTASSLRSWRASDGGYLYASCGTILAADLSGVESTWDVLTGQPVRFILPRQRKALIRPVCNSARTLFAGYAEKEYDMATSKLLFTGRFDIPPHSYPYGISPSGNYLAYSPQMGSSGLCIRHLPGTRSACYDKNLVVYADNSSGFSLPVSDGGWVAFVGETSEQCYYSGAGNKDASTTVRTNQVDECWGIYAASAASPPKLLVVPADDPQWVSPAIAAKLLASASKQRRRPR